MMTLMKKMMTLTVTMMMTKFGIVGNLKLIMAKVLGINFFKSG